MERMLAECGLNEDLERYAFPHWTRNEQILENKRTRLQTQLILIYTAVYTAYEHNSKQIQEL